jgi:hypothetical protein
VQLDEGIRNLKTETSWRVHSWKIVVSWAIILTKYFRETGCEDGRWMELAQDRVQWRALVLALLNLRVLLQESQLISKMALRETGCEDGRWM